MSQEIKDNFKDNDTYRAAGREFDNTLYQIQPLRDTSDEGVAAYRKQVEDTKRNIHHQKISIALDSNTRELHKFRLYDVRPVPTFEEIQAKAKTQNYGQLKETLAEYRQKREAVKADRDLRASWISEKNDKEFNDNWKLVIHIELPYICNKSLIIHDPKQWDKFKRVEGEKIAIDDEGLRIFDKIISGLERELKERENKKAVETLIREAQELANNQKRTVQKVKKILDKSADTLTYKDTTTFIECRETMSAVEDKFHTLALKFDNFQTSTEKFPSLDELTSDQLHYGTWTTSKYNDIVKQLEKLYREGKNRKEVGSKA